jgi:hypothetical protein
MRTRYALSGRPRDAGRSTDPTFTFTAQIKRTQEENDMTQTIKRILGPDLEQYDGVHRIKIYLLRLLFVLMFLFLGRDAWTHVLDHQGAWDPDQAVAWCVWASFSLLALLGIFRPLKMLPLVMLEIAYKVLWLIVVAYPLWSEHQLADSPRAEHLTYVFLLVVLPIVAMPWKYAFNHYVRGRTESRSEQRTALI